ncbi:hypothetical protein N5P37_010819 [Trichoderma harzianum]|nr:hypothetical protein N5P37_010819 [Trichoderma harzianum]
MLHPARFVLAGLPSALDRDILAVSPQRNRNRLCFGREDNGLVGLTDKRKRQGAPGRLDWSLAA